MPIVRVSVTLPSGSALVPGAVNPLNLLALLSPRRATSTTLQFYHHAACQLVKPKKGLRQTL